MYIFSGGSDGAFDLEDFPASPSLAAFRSSFEAFCPSFEAFCSSFAAFSSSFACFASAFASSRAAFASALAALLSAFCSAFALAASLACGELDEEAARLSALRLRLEALLRQAVPGVSVHTGGRTLPGILNFALPGLSGEELLMRLDLRGICISTGAACASTDTAPSHVLLAMGLSAEEARRSVRFSLGRMTTAEEVETAAAAVAEIHRNFARP